MAKDQLHVRGGNSESVWVIGDLFTFLVTAEQSDGKLSSLEALVQPHNGPGPHVHRDADEHFYVAEGDLTFWVGGESFQATTGDVVYVPRGTIHAFRNGPSMARLYVTFTPAGVEAYFRHIGIPATDHSAPPEMTPAMIESLVAASIGWERYNEALPPSALPGFPAG